MTHASPDVTSLNDSGTYPKRVWTSAVNHQRWVPWATMSETAKTVAQVQGCGQGLRIVDLATVASLLLVFFGGQLRLCQSLGSAAG
jgi:hypothetical protein